LSTIFTLCIFSDIYIKEKFQTQGLSSKEAEKLANESLNEFWIGNNKIAAITKNRIIILDKTGKRIYFVFPGAKIYIETSLPLDPLNIRSNEVGTLLQRIQFQMAVTPTNETKKIKNRMCKKYIVENWTMDAGARKGEVKRIVWLTTAVPFNLDLYWDVVTHILKLVNDDEAFFTELDKIKGLSMESESIRTLQGTSVTTHQEVVEITEKTAPAGIYSVPNGYAKQEMLSIPDLLTLLRD
jgi:hypothetical protein